MSALIESPVMELQRLRVAFQARRNGDSGEIAGTAVTYGGLNRAGRVIVPGAFAESVQGFSDRKPLVMGFEHAMFAAFQPIGRWTDVQDSEGGVQVAGRISDTTLGRDVQTLVDDGAVTGISIGFQATVVQYADRDERVTFETPYGTRSYQFDEYCVYVVKGILDEASIVSTPADDDARIAQSLMQKAARAMPALQSDSASWDDAAYSMALLMGGRGAGAFTDIPELERHALYTKLAVAYERHGKTPPAYQAAPDYRDVAFQHDERTIFADRYLRKTLASANAGAAGLDGQLSDETREEAERLIQSLQDLTQRRSPHERLAEISESLRQTTQTARELTRNV